MTLASQMSQAWLAWRGFFLWDIHFVCAISCCGRIRQLIHCFPNQYLRGGFKTLWPVEIFLLNRDRRVFVLQARRWGQHRLVLGLGRWWPTWLSHRVIGGHRNLLVCWLPISSTNFLWTWFCVRPLMLEAQLLCDICTRGRLCPALAMEATLFNFGSHGKVVGNMGILCRISSSAAVRICFSIKVKEVSSLLRLRRKPRKILVPRWKTLDKSLSFLNNLV